MAAKKRLLTTEDVAEMLGVSPQTIANWRLLGGHGLPHLKIDRMVRYRPDDVETFLANSEVGDEDDEDSDDDDFDDDDDDDDADSDEDFVDDDADE